MKKLLFLTIIISLFICVIGCGKQSDNGSESGSLSDDNQSVEAPNEEILHAFETLEGLIEKSYSSVNVDIAVTTDMDCLLAHYHITQNKVIYSIEQLNLFPSLDNVTDLSPEYKTTVSGEAVIDDGEVTDLDGNKITLPSGSDLTWRFNFNINNLQNVVVESGVLSAEVISASDFYGSEVDISDVKINVKYSDTAIERITLSYKTEKSSVEAVYEFES